MKIIQIRFNPTVNRTLNLNNYETSSAKTDALTRIITWIPVYIHNLPGIQNKFNVHSESSIINDLNMNGGLNCDINSLANTTIERWRKIEYN